MTSTQPRKSKSQKTPSTTSRDTPSTNKESWAEIRSFLDEAEAKLEEFGKRVGKMTAKMEKGAEKNLAKVDDQWEKSQQWLENQIENLKKAESKAETALDTVRVRAHLGKMEATDVAEDMLHRVDRLKGKVDGLTAKVSSETAVGLKKLSDACLRLRSKLVH